MDAGTEPQCRGGFERLQAGAVVDSEIRPRDPVAVLPVPQGAHGHQRGFGGDRQAEPRGEPAAESHEGRAERAEGQPGRGLRANLFGGGPGADLPDQHADERDQRGGRLHGRADRAAHLSARGGRHQRRGERGQQRGERRGWRLGILPQPEAGTGGLRRPGHSRKQGQRRLRQRRRHHLQHRGDQQRDHRLYHQAQGAVGERRL